MLADNGIEEITEVGIMLADNGIGEITELPI
jgi:hypothetical protein